MFQACAQDHVVAYSERPILARIWTCTPLLLPKFATTLACDLTDLTNGSVASRRFDGMAAVGKKRGAGHDRRGL
jgi:hypothetical protein